MSTVADGITSEIRERSEAADAALADFELLRSFYSSDAQLADALKWSEDTVRAWRHRSIKRPRLDHRETVEALLAICQEASRWVPEPELVGAWSLTPHEVIQGASPAQITRSLGKRGAGELLGIFPRVAPRISSQERPEFSAEELEAILAQASAISEPVKPAQAVEVDLSDFDD